MDSLQVIDNPVTAELADSFLEYSMSVIVARAIPDVRDGLKPVHRRILYSLHAQAIRPSSPYKKCARVVGDTMGRYHPHGDSAIYEALVRLAQPWSMAIPVVDGHGNFGSPDDGPAASRYTECRMSLAGASLLESIEENTVDFHPNYDATETEPSVLPAAFPNLLVNGGSGIAVGMASNIAPHNLAEVVSGICAMLDNPKIDLDEMMTHIPAPDFPTGGEIRLLDEVKAAYTTGRGTFRIRAKAHIIDVTARKRGIEITELPYQVGPEQIIAKIKELINAKKISSISDVKDLSDRRVGLRLVVECKTGFNPEAVLAELYRLTRLEDSFGFNAVALVHGQPETLGLLDMCRHYIEHRREVTRRRTEFRRDKAAARLHIVEGLLIALSAIDDVVATIRSSKDTETARKKLIKQFSLSEVQATHILEMPLRRLTSLEVTKLKDEARELKSTIRDLEKILASPKAMTELIKSELQNVADTFSAPRRSTLSDAIDPAGEIALEAPDEACVVALGESTLGKALAQTPRTKPTKADVFTALLPTTTRASIGVVTSTGRLHKLNVAELVDIPVKTTGAQAAEYIELLPGEVPLALVPMDPSVPVAIGTKNGVIKRLDPKTFPTRFPAEIISLADDDSVVGAGLCPDDALLVMVTSTAQLLKTPASKVRPQGRAAGGVAGIKLDESGVLYFAPVSDKDALVALITDSGAAKLTPLADYPEKGRATSGVRCCRLRATESILSRAHISTPDSLAILSAKGLLDAPELAKRDAAATDMTSPAVGFGLLRPKEVGQDN